LSLLLVGARGLGHAVSGLGDEVGLSAMAGEVGQAAAAIGGDDWEKAVLDGGRNLRKILSRGNGGQSDDSGKGEGLHVD